MDLPIVTAKCSLSSITMRKRIAVSPDLESLAEKAQIQELEDEHAAATPTKIEVNVRDVDARRSAETLADAMGHLPTLMVR